MTIQTALLSPEGRAWARHQLLEPQLEDLLLAEKLQIPSRFGSRGEAFEAIWKVFEEQMHLLQAGKPQRITGLADATGRSGAQVQELLAAVLDWPALVHGLRFRESDRGQLSMDGSALVVKTAPAPAYGPSVFGACSPAHPKEVCEVLASHALPVGSQRTQDKAIDSSAYLVEVNPRVSLGLASAVLPEGSQWDHTEAERYPLEIQEEVRKALIIAAGGKFKVKTGEILRKEIFAPFLASRARYAVDSADLLVESGWIACGPKGSRYRFLGGELDMIRFLQKNGCAPFLDLPRNLFPGPLKGQPLDCTFLLPDGREIAGMYLTWAAQVAFGVRAPNRKLKDVFRLVDDTTLQMTGADPDAVEYAFAVATVGKSESRKRMSTGLLVRNDGGTLSGWGVPGFDPHDNVQLRQAIVQAEGHIERMRPSGGFQRTVERLQAAGLQTMGVKLPQHRKCRENLILGADILLQRALLHL